LGKGLLDRWIVGVDGVFESWDLAVHHSIIPFPLFICA
jgi:hypothetical protein